MVVIWVTIFQTELMVEIYSKSLLRAIGPHQYRWTMIRMFKQTFPTLYLPHTSVGMTSCISIVVFTFKYLDSFDHYAASLIWKINIYQC